MTHKKLTNKQGHPYIYNFQYKFPVSKPFNKNTTYMYQCFGIQLNNILCNQNGFIRQQTKVKKLFLQGVWKLLLHNKLIDWNYESSLRQHFIQIAVFIKKKFQLIPDFTM